MSRKIICTVVLLFPFLINAQVDKTRVLILGTSHLHQIEGFEPFMLDSVIAKLDAFNFDVLKNNQALLLGITLCHCFSVLIAKFRGIPRGSLHARSLYHSKP